MPRCFTITVLCLALLSCAPAAANNSAVDDTAARGAGLSCFSIKPPRDRESSCDQLCAAKEAACVGLKTNGAMNPGIGCADVSNPKFISDYIASCRCCAPGK
jgi:hypothetical protein